MPAGDNVETLPFEASPIAKSLSKSFSSESIVIDSQSPPSTGDICRSLSEDFKDAKANVGSGGIAKQSIVVKTKLGQLMF